MGAISQGRGRCARRHAKFPGDPLPLAKPWLLRRQDFPGRGTSHNHGRILREVGDANVSGRRGFFAFARLRFRMTPAGPIVILRPAGPKDLLPGLLPRHHRPGQQPGQHAAQGAFAIVKQGPHWLGPVHVITLLGRSSRGEIGRHTGLKIPRPQGRAGSSPAASTPLAPEP